MKQLKHDHTLTKCLKVFIFSLMMLLPFMIWLPNAFYYGFNEQAVAQEKTEQKPIYYESNDVNSIDDIIIGNVYLWTDNITLDNTNRGKTFGNIKCLPLYLDINNNFQLNETTTFSSGYSTIGLNQSINNESQSISVNNIQIPMVFVSKTNDLSIIISHLTKYNDLIIKEYRPIEYSMSITDSMSLAWQQIWDNSLMTWTNNSVLKTPIDNFVNVFAINNDACISNYLIYLMTLTGIYVVIDIVLEMFIAITHIFSKETK